MKPVDGNSLQNFCRREALAHVLWLNRLALLKWPFERQAGQRDALSPLARSCPCLFGQEPCCND
eukprot:11832496-Alexandrium_andersonii.AAC.1